MRGTASRATVGWHARLLSVVLAFAVIGVVVGRLAVLELDDSPAPGPVREAALAERPGGTPSETSVRWAAGSPAGRDGQRALARAARVLHAWDAGRAVAYARGDRAALRRLYVPGSRAGARDLRVLRAYAERGLVLRDLRTQVLALEVGTATPRRLMLQVTDRRVGGRAVTTRGGRAVLALPRDAPSTRVVDLHRWPGGWRVAAVSEV